MTDINTLELESKNIVIYNLNENILMFEKNADEEVSIASLTKIMTTITAIEEISNLDEEVIITSQMLAGLVEADASLAGFVVGDIVTYRDLLFGTLLPSGADATRALAFSLFGSEQGFVNKMNEKVKELGLIHTHFVNTSGLDKKGHYSSVKDVATTLKYALDNPMFKAIYESKSYTTQSGKYKFYSTFNNYLNVYHISMPYVTGAKTGFTNAAGYCLSTTATLNRANYLVVTTGVDAKSNFPYHVTDAREIYNYYLENYQYLDIISEGESIITLGVKYAKEKELEIASDVTISKYLTTDIERSNLKYEYAGVKDVSPFTSTDKKLGEYKISYKEEVLGTVDIYLKDKIDFSLFDFLIQNILFIIIFILGIFVVYMVNKRNSLKKKKVTVKQVKVSLV